MTFKKILLLVAMALFCCGDANAQTDFFWSLNELNTGATNQDLVTEFAPGETGTLYLYYSTNGPADSDIDTGAFVDIATSSGGIIQFTAASTLNFDITLFGMPAGSRWDNAGEASSISDDNVSGMSALAIFASGMVESNNGSGAVVDTGFDAAADAFLFAEVDFTVLPEAAGGTMVDILASPGIGGIVNGGAPVPATFGGATIMITEDIILGDMNGDGDVTMCDVNPFVQAILSPTFNEVADINQDGFVSLLDVRPFVEILTGK